MVPVHVPPGGVLVEDRPADKYNGPQRGGDDGASQDVSHALAPVSFSFSPGDVPDCVNSGTPLTRRWATSRQPGNAFPICGSATFGNAEQFSSRFLLSPVTRPTTTTSASKGTR